TEIVKIRKLCTGCGACYQACPSAAVTMSEDPEGFLFPEISQEKCTDCGLCVRLCPVNKALEEREDSLAVGSAKESTNVYACFAKDDSLRLKSSSGGMFSLLAQSLSQGPVEKDRTKTRIIFGAEFDESFNVRHGYVSDISELDRLRRSKYVQSDTGETFKAAKSFLSENVHVLYCGTPCQIAGLKAYLGKDYRNLITCDIACHGVPSPKVWRMFLEYIKAAYGSDITSISFRNKELGWKHNRMVIEFENGRRYSGTTSDETFFMGFGKSLFNRRSCHNCCFRVDNSKADLTLADFWGIEALMDDSFNDDRGVSCVLTHTHIGEIALDHIRDSVIIRKCQPADAVRGNPRLVSSIPEPAGRSAFFADMAAGYDFNALRKKYMDNFSPKFRLKRLVQKVLKPETLNSLRKILGKS
ncbi:MAG: 4Fe-4S dicluster domain-containing protein, partial [Clostridiales bacterium]|nr:4Fe-4S dicluster domain-containing protein [Clostridiales bacterium]